MVNDLFLLAVVVGVVGSVLLQGLRRIPASPPHKGQGTFLGMRIPKKIYNEGWVFCLFFPYLFGFILVKMERITLDVISEKTRTPDRAESRIPVLLTFRPHPNLFINYLDSGGEEGVKTQLRGVVLEKIREWGMGPEGGPANWIELNQSQMEAVSVLVKHIAGASLTEIPKYAQAVPTWVWLLFYSQPRPIKLLTNEVIWGENDWQRVRGVLKTIEEEYGSSAIIDLEKALNERRKDVERLRAGNGEILIPDLGIVLERLNLGNIEVLGLVGEQAEGEAKEEQERKKEELELKFVRERIAELMLPPLNYSRSEARDIVQVERDKVKRVIEDNQISLDFTTAQVLAKTLSAIGGNK